MKKIKDLTKLLFWDVDLEKLDIEKNKNFIIHRVLSYGTMNDIRKIFEIYGVKTVREEFLKNQLGIYYPQVLKLCQHLLGVEKIDKNKYLKIIK